jgi:hypothetical protein
MGSAAGDQGELRLQRDSLQGCADLYTALDCARNRTKTLVNLVRSFRDLLLVIGQLQSIGNVNAAYDQYVVIEFDLTFRI